MTMRYSASRNGFFPTDIDYPDLPSDLVSITDELWRQLLDGQSQGGRIAPDENGYPALYPQLPLTQEEIFAVNATKKQSLMAYATVIIAPLQDAADLDDATPEEMALLKKWKQYRVALNRINTDTTDDITWPALPA